LINAGIFNPGTQLVSPEQAIIFIMKQIPQPYIVRLAAILIAVSLTVLALYYLKVVLVPLLFAIIFAVMVFPFCLRLEKWGFSKGLLRLYRYFFSQSCWASWFISYLFN
jgi:hypothetical protein